MIYSYDFLKEVIDALTEHIVVIDEMGKIIFVNNAWIEFGKKNSSLITADWRGINYLKYCDKAADMGDSYGIEAAEGIRRVINSDLDIFHLEYPCHSPNEKRWFMMCVKEFFVEKSNYYLISHQNITERKLAEEEIFHLSRMDSLTNIHNRRSFDDFLEKEWNRCLRLNMPITLAIIDIDHFKFINDTFGHKTGDDYLKTIANTIQLFAKRPSDMCARYGGEEFAIVYGNTTLDESKSMITDLMEAIHNLHIPNEKSPVSPLLTVSIGLATFYPNSNNNIDLFIKTADELLYHSKNNGRNQITTN